MWKLDHGKGWAPKNWCFRTVVLEKTLESLSDSKETKPVKSKGNQPWIFIGRPDAEAEDPILWPPDAKSRLTGKDPIAWKGGRQEEKGATEDELFGQYHWFNGHEFEQTLGNSDRLFFLGLQNHCRQRLQPGNKRSLLLGRKTMTNPDRVLKSRDITLLTKILIVKAMVSPVVIYDMRAGQ